MKNIYLIPLVFLSTSTASAIDNILFSETFNITASGSGSVGYLDFSLSSQQTIDIFTNGPTTDPQIYLFNAFQANITPDLQAIATDDDSCPDSRCGQSAAFNNALIDDILLDAGDYTVAVSDFNFSESEATSGSNNNDRTGDIAVCVGDSNSQEACTLGVTIDATAAAAAAAAAAAEAAAAEAEAAAAAAEAAAEAEAAVAEAKAIAQIEVEQSRSQQVTRATNTQVAQHLATEISRSFGFILPQSDTKLAASSDTTSNYLPETFWGKWNYSNLSEDGATENFTTDLYQFVGGLDKRLGDFYMGSALTYVYGDTRQSGGNNSSSNTIGVIPYAAYKINDYLFASLLAGYNYTHVNGTNGNQDVDVHDYITEFGLNGFKIINSVIIKGRAGIRYKHNFTSLENSLDADFDELTWIGDVQFDYNMNESFTVYTGALYEYRDTEAYNTSSIATAGSNVIHDGVVFIRAGFDYRVTPDMAIGLSASTEVTDEDNDLYTVGLNLRLKI